METRRWMNHSLPQTLNNAVLLLYISAAFDLLTLSPIMIVIAGAKVAAGYLIANERKIGYQLGLGVAFFPFVIRFLFFGVDGIFGTGIISLLFEIILVVLLLHEQSREHQRIWFS